MASWANIIGLGEVEGTRVTTTSLEGMIFEAVEKALADAGLARSDLDGLVIAASDQTDGRAISSMLTSGPAGAYLNDEINIASSPGHAFAMACLQIDSGVQRRVLVASWGKASEIAEPGIEGVERLSAEPFFERDAALTPLVALGMQAGLYRHSRPQAAKAAAAVAAKSHTNAADAGIASAVVDADEVMRSPLVADPLRELEVSRAIDGVYALVLADGRSHDGPAVAVAGMGWASEAYRLSDRDLIGAPHLRIAAEAAFREAGVVDRRSEIAVWELHDHSSDAELIAYEAVGLCGEGGAAELALSGTCGRDGDLPVNPLGGALAGEAPFGGGLRKLVRATRYVRGEIPSVRTTPRAFVQIASGMAGQFQSAFVLGGAE